MTETARGLRMGLVGTGPWARLTTGPGLRVARRAEAVGVWGRDPERTADVAGEVGLRAYDDFETLLDDVDAVAFSVAPMAQGELALRAARAGKHLLLDKPVALDVHAAEAVLEAASQADVAALVFFTDRFMPSSAQWFTQAAATPGWVGGLAHWIGSLDSTPFGASPWRRQHGAFWDLGPHVLSTFTAVLGPVHELSATAGVGDIAHLVARHESGVTSCATVTHYSTTAAESTDFFVWGAAGISHKPPREDRTDLAFANAVDTLAELVSGNGAQRRSHPSGLESGVHQVRLLAAAHAAMHRSEEPEGPLGIA
jgi:predicted dehydrogenase